MIPASAIYVVIFAFGALAALAGWAIWYQRRSIEVEQWPETEATIQSAEIETVGIYRGSVELPVCEFSYNVNGEYYSGSFALSRDDGSSDYSLKELVDRQIAVRYEPRNPSKWHISPEALGGFTIIENPGPIRDRF